MYDLNQYIFNSRLLSVCIKINIYYNALKINNTHANKTPK